MNAVLEGYRRDSQGRLVPIETIDEIDLARDDLVHEIVDSGMALRDQMEEFKGKTMGDIDAFVALSAEKYGVKLGGVKGNITLSSYDGRYKVQLSIADRLVFDERLQAARELVSNCIHKWVDKSRAEIKALVEHAFQTDRQGRINTGRIINLTRLAIDDEEWKNAMRAIRDSMRVDSTKPYIRLYERVDGTDEYRQIALDLAAI